MIKAPSSYYKDKAAVLADVFGTSYVEIEQDCIVVDAVRYPVVEDVIVLLPPDRYPRRVVDSLGTKRISDSKAPGQFAPDVQDTFGEEWQAYPEMLTEHEKEFSQYFDLIDITSIETATVCDLGCGSGRWITTCETDAGS
jgi:hypothetical protein